LCRILTSPLGDSKYKQRVKIYRVVRLKADLSQYGDEFTRSRANTASSRTRGKRLHCRPATNLQELSLAVFKFPHGNH